MTRQLLFFFLITIPFLHLNAQQNSYSDSLVAYQESYVKEHDVVKGKDKQYMHFYKPDESFRINTRFERIYEAPWFKMPTSANSYQVQRVYGILHFSVNDTAVQLHVYQSKDLMHTKKYADYLFVPFTDKTCGSETYDNGRYIDLKIQDTESGSCVIDFNKAYNPYCAYVTGKYNCPIPPKENDLPVAIRAGEMAYGKH